MDFALFEAVKSFNYLTGDSKLDDDFVDRINRYWSALLMILFAVILSARQIVGDPLRCWTPQEFKDAWIEYAEDYCWVKNTYFVPKGSSMPDGKAARQQQEIGYYQWIPYVLTLQAFMYYLPAMIWRILNWKCGIDLTSIVSRAASNSKLDGLAFQLGTNMRLRATSERKDSFLQRNFLTCLYLFVKVLYTLNAVGQFFLLSSFFGGAVDSLFRITRDLASGVEWFDSGHFPRITFCDFSVRRFAQPVNHYTVQCVLTINIFTEKIFVFAGYWMLLVAVLTLLNSFAWFAALLLPWRRHSFLRDLLPETARHDRHYFLEKCLGTDGLLVFHLIATNSDEIIAGRVMKKMWDEFSANPPESDFGESPAPSAADDSPMELSELPSSGDANSTLLLPSRAAAV